MTRASSAVKSPVASVRCSTTQPQARPRVTIAARISCGVPIGARNSVYPALRSGLPRVVSLRIATGDRRPARLAKVLTSSRAYSLATTAAAANGSVEVCNLLIESGADVNARQQGGWTPLHAAVAAGNKELEALLLEHDADTAVTNDEGKTVEDLRPA